LTLLDYVDFWEGKNEVTAFREIGLFTNEKPFAEVPRKNNHVIRFECTNLLL
jgi:hypothetical protein